MRASSARIVRMYLHRGVISMPSSFSTVWCQRDLVGDRRDVVHPVDDRHVLVEVEIFAEFLEAGVQVADVGHGLDDGLAVECEDEAQCGVRGRVLRAEVQSVEELLVRAGDVLHGSSCFKRHEEPLALRIA